MGFSVLLAFVFLLPVPSVLLLLFFKLVCQEILSSFREQAGKHSGTRPPPGSVFFGRGLHHADAVGVAVTRFLYEEVLSVCRYDREAEEGTQGRAAAALGEQAPECVFCPGAIEESEVVGEPGRRRVFHRACLARWVERRPAACPLR